ncbi:MAG: response regulator, partial [Pseudomonadota bacterium]
MTNPASHTRHSTKTLSFVPTVAGSRVGGHSGSDSSFRGGVPNISRTQTPAARDNPRNGQAKSTKATSHFSGVEFPEGTMVDGRLIPHDDAPHILVVDDDARIRSLLMRFLNESGFRVSQASNADEAARKLEGISFDLMVLDVMMPGQDGL